MTWTPHLVGPHARLEPLQPEHAEALWDAASDRDVWTYMMAKVESPTDLRRWIEARLEPVAKHSAQAFLIRDAAGTACGSTSLFDITPHKTMEVGHTWLGAAWRRTAVNTQAKRLILGHAFETLHAIRVQLKCDERNARSRAAILRLGATFEGILRHQTTLPDGHKRNGAIYSIIDTEWPGVRQLLDDAVDDARRGTLPNTASRDSARTGLAK